MPYKCKEAARAYQKAYSKDYREANKEKIAAKKKAWYEANKEKIAVRKKAYYQANREEIIAYQKDYYQANKEKFTVRKKVWRKANKEKINEQTARRRAVKRKRIPIKVRDCPIEKERLRQIYKLSHMFTKATGVQHHVDHMWPLDKKGPHWSGNLQIITATENLRKNAKLNKNIKATVQEMLDKDIHDAY